MMSVFWLIAQHQFLFLCYMLPMWRFGSMLVDVCECGSVVCIVYCVFFFFHLTDHFDLLKLGSVFI